MGTPHRGRARSNRGDGQKEECLDTSARPPAATSEVARTDDRLGDLGAGNTDGQTPRHPLAMRGGASSSCRGLELLLAESAHADAGQLAPARSGAARPCLGAHDEPCGADSMSGLPPELLGEASR